MRRVFSNTLQRKELELLSSGGSLARIYLSEMDELEAAIRGSSAVALTETI
jgi:hypothetical protein